MPAARHHPSFARSRAEPAEPAEPTEPTALVDVLEPLAVRVATLHADAVGWEGPNQLVAVRAGDGADLEVALAPVDGDLAEGIVGFTAPDGWDAVGAAALGWLRPLDERGRPGRREGRTRTVLLVHRSGATASVLWPEGGDPDLVPGPVEGRIADLLRRAVGLPTAPPEASVVELFALHWLAALLEAEPGSLATWEAVAGHHPLLVQLDAGENPAAAGCLVAMGGPAGLFGPWDEIRRSCARGALTLAGVDPALAGWFDEGSFARWVLGSFPRLEVLLDAVEPSLAPAAARELREALRTWGLVTGPGLG